MEKVLLALRAAHVEPRLTYNRHHIALGTTGRNFCWFYPRKSPETCNIEFRVPADRRDAIVSGLQEIGIGATSQRTELGAFNITMSKLQEHLAIILDMLKIAEEASKS